jgi:hypothetical protein
LIYQENIPTAVLGDLMVNLSITSIIMACLRSVSLRSAEIIEEIEICRCFGCEMRRVQFRPDRKNAGRIEKFAALLLCGWMGQYINVPRGSSNIPIRSPPSENIRRRFLPLSAHFLAAVLAIGGAESGINLLF